ncbi:MAG TPA: hypothetical protein VIH04_02180 [Nitrosarchaeum sp.]
MTNPLDKIETYLNAKIKCDPDIVMQLPRIYLSAYTDNPINAFLIAPSSEGKTYATVTVSEIFPKEDVIIIGRMSPAALIHQNGELQDKDGFSIQDSIDFFDEKIAEAKGQEKTEFKRQKRDLIRKSHMCVDLKNKILIFIDNPHQETYETLKPIMSHDKKEIVYKTTKGDGSLEVKESVIRNWPVFIFCSAKNEAKNEVWAEMKNRTLMLSPNTDVKKYAEANKLTGQKFGLPTWCKSLYENLEDKELSKDQIRILKERLNQLCEDGNNPVINVFNDKISQLFPKNTAETMRHYARFNSLVNLETLINADNNPALILEKDGKRVKSIFTTMNDIVNACKMLGNISTLPPDKIKFMDKVFTPLLSEKLDGTLTTTWLAEKYTAVFGKPIMPKQILENYCNYLEDSGILESEQEHIRAEKHYKIASIITLNNLDNLKSNLIESSNANDLGVDSCLEQLHNHSIHLGFTDRFYEYDSRIITVDELKSILLDESNHQK